VAVTEQLRLKSAGLVTASSVTPQAVDDAAEVSQNGSVTIDLLENDRGGGARSVYSVDEAGTTGAASSSTLLSGALVTLVDGNLLYDPNGKFDFLGTGSTATDTFEYLLQVGNGAISKATVTITVIGENDAAAIGELGDHEVTEDESPITLTATGQLAVVDVDNGEAFFSSEVAAAEGNLGSLTLAADGSYAFQVSNAAAQHLGAGDTKVDTFTVLTLDGTSKELSFTVHGAADVSNVLLRPVALGQTIEDSWVGSDISTVTRTTAFGSTTTVHRSGWNDRSDEVADRVLVFDPLSSGPMQAKNQGGDPVIGSQTIFKEYLGTANTEQVVRNYQYTYIQDIRSVAEFALTGPVSNATLVFESAGSMDFNAFVFSLYAGDGVVTATDRSAGAGDVAGTWNAATRRFEVDLDEALINQLLANGATHIGVNVRATGPFVGQDYSTPSFTDVVYDDGPGGSVDYHQTTTSYHVENIHSAFFQAQRPILDITYIG
jgi:VCBS repeat-containing protein